MALDWSVLIATFGGAILGMAGEGLGRRRQRLQDNLVYARSRDEWERQQRLAREEDQIKRVHEQELLAAATIIDVLQENAVGPLRPTDDSTEQMMFRISQAVSVQRLYIRNSTLRRRLGQAVSIVDVFSLGGLEGAGLNGSAAIWLIRVNVLRWLAAWFRSEDMPEATEDWVRVIEILEQRLPHIREQLAVRGIILSDFRYIGDLF